MVEAWSYFIKVSSPNGVQTGVAVFGDTLGWSMVCGERWDTA